MKKRMRLAVALRNLVGCVALVGAGALITSNAVSGNEPDQKPAGGQPQMDPAMAKMIEMGTPGKEHALLDAMIGDWNAESTVDMGQGQTMTSKATSSNHWILDNRYIQQDYAGDMMGTPFTGMSLIGYDKYKKQFFASWIDSMSTMFYISYGEYDAATKTFTFEGTGPDCQDPSGTKMCSMQNKVQIVSKDKHIFTMSSMKDGKMVEGMKIVYTRK
ncbi:MAG: DUF1579 domain-containing protein [Phycisphaerales bacterium]|nr:DUF1579 domain-containing protein [Phycisphaerales bacterium]MCB9862282.1 DUF1579 domain-containing protein [Phycisphaerales bacterium]